MLAALPQGWVKTTLGEIVTLSRERVLPTELPDMPYVGLEHIEPQTMKLLGHGYARDVRSSSVRFSNGDVLYGKMRPDYQEECSDCASANMLPANVRCSAKRCQRICEKDHPNSQYINAYY
jgi:hypothetical protein